MAGKTDVIKGRIKEAAQQAVTDAKQAAHIAIAKATEAAEQTVDKAKQAVKKMSE